MATSDSTPVQFPLLIEGATIEIPLTKGYFTTIDAADADLAMYKWCATVKETGAYALRALPRVKGKHTTIYLHRVILERVLEVKLTSRQEVDHEDLNTLNNLRSNLRLATHKQNQCNQPIQQNNTSGVAGVSWIEHKKKWRAYIKVDGKQIHLGIFTELADAVAARHASAAKYFGEFARFD